MSNRKELRDARRRLAKAEAELSAIEALPRRVGDQVWWSNGVVWERMGDDRWLPSSSGMRGEFEYPSAHVASGTIVVPAAEPDVKGSDRG